MLILPGAENIRKLSRSNMDQDTLIGGVRLADLFCLVTTLINILMVLLHQ